MATLDDLQSAKKVNIPRAVLTGEKAMSPAVRRMIEAELQRKGAMPAPKKAWDAKDTPVGVYDMKGLRGAAKELWASKDFLICISGPSECVAGETRLYNPETGEHTPIADLCRDGIAPVVQTLLGPAQAEIPFLKGVARLYRVKLANGQSFLGTTKHTVLTVDRGWVFLSQLQSGDRVPSAACGLLAKRYEVYPSKSRQGVQHWNYTTQDCRESYSVGPFHLCGEQLPWEADTCRELVPSRDGVREQGSVGRNEDVLAYTEGHSRAYRCGDLLSSSRSQHRHLNATRTGFHVSANKPLHDAYLSESHGQSLKSTYHQQPFDEEENRYLHKRAFFDTSYLLYEQAIKKVPWTTVISVEFERVDSFYDLHVPGAQHYLAEGVWHHNTGKSWGAIRKVNAFLWKYPGAQWVILRKTYSSAIATCVMTYKRIIGENSGILAYGGNKPEWFDYPNGSRLWVGGLDNLAKVLSGERDGYYFNQAEEGTLEEVETLTTRTTGRGAVMPYTQVILDVNPGSQYHWILSKAKSNLKLLRSYHQDNPTLFDYAPEGTHQCDEWPDVSYNGQAGRWTDQGRRTISILDNLTGLRRDRLYLGKWVQAEGTVYEFDSAIHTVPSFKIPKEWRRIRVIDFGYENPLVCLWAAVDPDGRIYIYREIYLTHVLVSEIARDIRKLSVGENIECTICDHDAEDRATLAAEGIRSIPAYKKVSPGIQKVQDYLKVAGDGRPRLMILRDSQEQAPLTYPLVMPDAELSEKKKPTRGAQEFEYYVWAKDVSGKPNKEEPVKEYDHFCDCVRYLCAYVSGMSKRRGRAY